MGECLKVELEQGLVLHTHVMVAIHWRETMQDIVQVRGDGLAVFLLVELQV